MGTALGDFLADSSGLGFAGGALLIGGCLTIVVLFHYRTNVSKTLLFWIAFVLTRPFGATMGDVLTKPKARGGLGLGTVGSSAVLATVLAVLVVYSTMKQKAEVPAPARGACPRCSHARANANSEASCDESVG